MDIEKVLDSLTVDEKASLLSGDGFWRTKAVKDKGVESIFMSDGPNGIRKQDESQEGFSPEAIEAICYPTAVTMASSFDTELIRNVGEKLGEECQSMDVQVILGPGINMKRSPLCGRNFEYYSEDPFLAGQMGIGFVKGVQSKGVGVALKHFAANNQETRRFVINAEIDKRSLHEIYLRAFEDVVKQAKPWTLMCSYNRINGVYSCENKYILTDVLKDKWGFDGLVMTDWGAMHDKLKSVEAGLALEMPTSQGVRDNYLAEAVKEKRVSETAFDDRVREVLNLVNKGLEGREDYKRNCGGAIDDYSKEEHHSVARRVATESAVLLKNDKCTLPLSKNTTGDNLPKYAFIGEFASVAKYQGGGSSHINPYRVDAVVDALKEYKGVKITCAQGYSINREDVKNKKIDEDELLDEAIGLAAKSDVSVIFAGLPDEIEYESFDRANMNLPDNQNRLISEIAKVSERTVVVLFNGSPITMPWIDEVDSVLEMYLAGEGLGYACTDLLFGTKSPSGHLAETFPLRIEDTPAFTEFPGGKQNVRYSEGIYIGYRYYDKKKLDVLFPFGHGLTYTTFEYKDLKLERGVGACDIKVLFTLKNTGDCAAAEVPQVYVENAVCDEHRPVRELRGFKKIFLKPGEEKQIEFQLDRRAFTYYDIDLDDWYAPSGEYVIAVGSSSRDLKLKKSITINSGEKNSLKVDDMSTFSDIIRRVGFVEPLKAFARKAGYDEACQIDMENFTLEDMTMNNAQFYETPLHSIMSFNPGGDKTITYEFMQQTIDAINAML